MSDRSRFPATCSPLAPEHPPDPGGLTLAPAPDSAELGSCADRCSPEQASLALPAVVASPAPQAALAVASHWSGRAAPKLEIVRRGLRDDREDRKGSGKPRRVDAFPGGSGHASAYHAAGSSLSIRFFVHETGGSVGRSLNTGRNFGRHVRSLRRARGMTQEVLAERSGLSADTIRRLEHGSFSPSLETLRKLCAGLDLMLSTLFESFEIGVRNESRELVDLLATRSPRELVLATRVLRALFDELDGIAADEDS